MGVQRGPKIPTDNLWGCWDAASKSSYPGSGTTWKSLTGSPDAAMDSGSSDATYSSFSKGCIEFDGSAAVTIADADLEVSGAFTFSIWVYFTNDTDKYTVFSLRGGTGWGDDEFAISMLNRSWQPESLRLGCKGTNGSPVMGTYTANTYGPEQNLNVWRHYLAVYDGVDRTATSSFKFYFDGVYQGAFTGTETWGIAYNGTSWGRDGHTGSNGLFEGYLGSVLLYSKAFTASEVWNLHIQQRGRFR